MNYQQTVGAVSRCRWPVDSSQLLIYCGEMTLQGAQKLQLNAHKKGGDEKHLETRRYAQCTAEKCGKKTRRAPIFFRERRRELVF